MLRKTLTVGLAIAVLTIAAPAGAQFMAADLLYVSGVADTEGVGDSRWVTNLAITNVEEEVEIDVAIVYLPTGLISNGSQFIDRSTWLGGREDDGFGLIDPALADIPPGGTVMLPNPLGQYWPNEGETVNFGALVIFAYEANTLEDDGTRVYANAIVNSRVSTSRTFYEPDSENEGEFVEVTGSYGQTLPGVPWYNLADPSAIDDEEDLTFLILAGALEGDDFRYNVGVLNASDPLTSITLVLQPFQGNGEPYLDDNEIPVVRTLSMPPLSHIQYNNVMSTLFGIEETPPDSTIRISFVNWSSGSSVPVVGMTVYGTLIDNRTNDPTAILPSFAYPYNIECQWPSSDGTKSQATGLRRVSQRPLAIPSR